MTEVSRDLGNEFVGLALHAGEIFDGNYPYGDRLIENLSKATRYSLGIGPTVEEALEDALSTDLYESGRIITRTFNREGNIIPYSAALILTPKASPLENV